MRKKMFSLLLVIGMLFAAGCGSTTNGEQKKALEITPVTTDNVAEAIDTLLTRDYIVCYLWYCDGLQAEGELNAEHYYQVSAESGYTSMNDLRTLVEGTYTMDLAASLIDIADGQGRPRFVEEEGQLYKSAYPVLSQFYWDYDSESVEILSDEGDLVTFTVDMTNLLSDTQGKKTVQMEMRRDNGTWQLCEVSVLAAEGGSIQTTAPTAREIADKFLAALRANDTATVAALAGESEESYSAWKSMTVTAAVTGTLEEYDGYGRYQVRMNASGSAGAFPSGEKDYILIVSSDNDTGTPLVCYLEPSGEIAYNFSEQKDDPACDMTERYLRAEGYVKFKNGFWMENSIATDFVLTELYAEKPQQSYTEEEVKAAAAAYLGYEDFTPDESYRSEGGFILPGRAPKTIGSLLIWPSTSENGNTVVRVESYSDRLHTQNQQTYLFTFRINTDGSRRLISVT